MGMLPLLREWNRSLTYFQKNCFSSVPWTICSLKSVVMLVCVLERNLGLDKFFQYLSNEAKIRERLIVVQFTMIKTQLFDCRSDMS